MKNNKFSEYKENKIVKDITDSINNRLFSKLNYNNFNIFLVGAGKENPNSIRKIIREILTKWQYINRIDVYYPEDLFEELVKSKPDFNLLSLENLLAKSVHAIVIVLESPGAIAELGAFSNHNLLKDKIVVIVDKKYKNKKSFINLGPIRYLKETRSKVIFYDYNELNTFYSYNNTYKNLSNLNLDKIIANFRFREKLIKAIRDISNEAEIDNTVSNPIRAQYFLLSAIYIMEPIRKEKINIMLKYLILEENNIDKIETIFNSSLNILVTRKEVSLRDEKYSLTQNGIDRLYQSSSLCTDRAAFKDSLNDLRIKILNSTLRGDLYRNKRRELNDLSWAI